MDESTARSRHPDSIGQAFLWALLPTLVLFLSAPSAGDAQVTVTTSITHTPGAGDLGTTVTQAGNLYNITGGTRPGSGPNLFHSFGDLSVGGGDIANFLNNNNTGLQTSNIIGRVTGGNISNIYGTIQTTGFGNANLFLVNPSGFVFGPHGSLNVTGSVSFTTAQYLRLSDGVNSANFYANPAFDGLANSILVVDPVANFGFLSSAAPAAYGFLTPPGPNATITVQGSELSVPPGPPGSPGNSISLVGGKVVIQGATLPDGTVQPAHLSAPNGTIQLASTASPGEFDVATLGSLPNVNGTSFTSFGSVTLAPGSSIDVSGARTVFVKGGQLVLSVNDATLSTSESPAPSDTVSLSLGSSIATSNSGADPGADVQITVGNLQADGAVVTTINSGDVNGGNISINATTVGFTNVASVLSFTGLDFTTGEIVGSGNGGNVTVQGLQGAGSAAGSVSLSNAAISVGTFGSGRGGDVVIAAGNVHLVDFSTISTQTSGQGRGGDVHITADSLTLENSSSIITTTSDLGVVGGDLFLNVGTLRLLGGPFGGSQIESINSTGTDLNGDGVVDVTGVGGNVTVQGTTQGAKSAADSVVLSGGSGITSDAGATSGSGGGISIRATSLDLDEASMIKSSTSGTGHGGDIVVAVQQLRVVDDATITSNTNSENPSPASGGTVTVQGLDGPESMVSSVLLSGQNTSIFSGSASGMPGDITVNAGTLTITNGAVIAAGSPQFTGPAGKVTVKADSVVISADGKIFSRSFAQENGKVTITANALTLDNGSIDTKTSSESGKPGGNVVLDVGTVSLTNGARITSQSEPFSTGRAGNITITGESLTLANHAEITSSSKGTVAKAGDAGNVTIMSSGAFTSNASTIATSAENAKGGNIDVTAQSVALSNGAVMSASSRSPLLPDGEGNAGNITIHSGSTVVMNNSSMTTEASQASGGQITITAPEMVQLINSRVSTTVAGSATDTAGGNIMIDPQFVVLQNSQVLAQAFAGTGGNITIISNVFLTDPSSLVDASSQLGISGQINIQSPVQNVGGQLTPLSQQFSSAAALLAQQCAARAADAKFSTFVVAGREGLPVEPGGFLASPSWTTELLGSSLSGRDRPTQFSAVTGLFQEYDARPIQLAMFGNACHRQ